jgi:hypothetical protein
MRRRAKNIDGWAKTLWEAADRIRISIKDEVRSRRLKRLSSTELIGRLHRVLNFPEELTPVIIGSADVETCDKNVLFAYLRGYFRHCAELYSTSKDHVGGLGHLLFFDSLYRIRKFDQVLSMSGCDRETKPPDNFSVRYEQIVRRALFHRGYLTQAAEGFTSDGLERLDFAELVLRAEIWDAIGEMPLATDAYERAISKHPASAYLRLRHAFHYLKRGRIVEGLASWGMAESIFGKHPLRPARILWRGESLEHRTLLVDFEHGFGDVIQFARFLIVLRKRWPSASVIGCVPDILISLLSRSMPDVRFVDNVSPAPQCDYYISSIQLPLILGVANLEPSSDYINLASFPPHPAPRSMLRVGVCWRGYPRDYDYVRSIPIDKFAVLFDVIDITFVVLLHQLRDDEAVALRSFDNVEMPAIRNFGDLGDAIDGCDIVVSVDTAVVHVAAAGGKPTILLSRPDSCWRWGHEGESSAWYPSVHIIRHRVDLDWSHVLGQAARLLSDRRDEFRSSLQDNSAAQSGPSDTGIRRNVLE